jgi:hypothetical protein
MNQPGQPAPLAGIEKGGYKLVWKDTPNPYDKGRFGSAKVLSLAHSLGIVLNREGVVTDPLEQPRVRRCAGDGHQDRRHQWRDL